MGVIQELVKQVLCIVVPINSPTGELTSKSKYVTWTKRRVVEFEKAKRFADQLGIPYLETSSNDEMCLDRIMMTILSEIKKKQEENMRASDSPSPRWNCQCQ